jgi:tetratricopeptide (TPR) repeat protein
VAFELGILYTREQDFARAEAAYARALRMRLGQNSRAKVLGNLAEVVMSQGDLERAVSLYEQALEDGLRHERVLSLWGLAVALDRLGETSESLARARQALREDVRPMGALHQSGVFFVPAYELHYYEGLGFLALAYNEASDTDKPQHIVRDHARVLERAANGGVLLSLKQTLSMLEDEGHAARVKPLYQALERALKKGEKTAKLANPEAPESAEVRAAKVVLHTVQALRAFARYLDRGGSTGPWAAHAAEHVAEISSWFDAPRSAKAAQGRYNQAP